jgi:hypothetical protein
VAPPRYAGRCAAEPIRGTSSRKLRAVLIGARTSAGSRSALFGGPGVAEHDPHVRTFDDPGSRQKYPGAMARISGRIRIAAPVERVFDTAADSRNEPSFNPAMTRVELLTPLPIELGTRFRARMGKAGGEMLVELTEFERPHRLSSRTASAMMGNDWRADFRRRGRRHGRELGLTGAPEGWMRMLDPLVVALGGPHGAPDLDRAEAPARRRWKRSLSLTTDHRRLGLARTRPHRPPTASESRYTPHAADEGRCCRLCRALPSRAHPAALAALRVAAKAVDDLDRHRAEHALHARTTWRTADAWTWLSRKKCATRA